MNRIVHDHYPASRLPDDLRDGTRDGASVRVTVEEESPVIGKAELRALTLALQSRRRGTTIEEAVARIRELRDEWDDR